VFLTARRHLPAETAGLSRTLVRQMKSRCLYWAGKYAGGMTGMGFTVRPARTADVPGIQDLLEPYVQRRILLGKDRVLLYESVQEFVVAEDETGRVAACGALHVIWEDIAEVRTLIVADDLLHRGAGRAIVDELEARARTLGVRRLFCLTFEVDFFTRRGFAPIGEQVVDPDVYSQLVRSPDEGVAEFLDLAHVKPNTLGNTRMLKTL
jgi:amino-acid N-acetyltransferase